MNDVTIINNIKEINKCDTQYVFIVNNFNEINTNELRKKIILWQDKYPKFGYINTNLGYLIDKSKIEGLKLHDNIKYWYYELIFNGIVAIKNEIIDNIIQQQL